MQTRGPHPTIARPRAFLPRSLCIAIAAVLAVQVSGCASTAPLPRFAPPSRLAEPTAPVSTGDPGRPVEPPRRTTPTDDETIDRPTSDPYNGDLSIFEHPGRAEKLQIDRVMSLLGIEVGKTVADVGAGSGWFTVRAAKRVGPGGTVYAVEINPRFIDHIAARAAKEKLGNVRTVLGTPEDPRLPDQSLDAVLLLKTYHEIEKPIAVMKRLRRAMRPAARLGIIDRKGHGDDHGVEAEAVLREVTRSGFELLERHDFVKGDGMDYFFIFRPAGG
jgi:SAM-dependent methyltransferase